MYTVFDDVQPMSARQVKSNVKIYRDAEGVLEDQDLGSRGDSLLGPHEVHVVVVQPTININGSGAGIADRVRYNNVGWDLEQDLSTGSNPRRKQEAEEPHPRMRKAVCVADTNLPGEGLLVLDDGRPFD